MRNSGMNMPRVKQENRSSILRCILEHGATSRKDIARLTGLTPAAVTQLCAELLAEGLLAECGSQLQSAKTQGVDPQGTVTLTAEAQGVETQNFEAQGAGNQSAGTGKRGAGRKKILLDINAAGRHLLVISLGVETTFLAVSDLKGECLCRTSLPTDRGIPPVEFLARVAEAAHAMLQSAKTPLPRLCGVSVTVPGAVDKERGLSLQAYGLWDGQVEVCRLLGDALGLPVCIENNVNAFAVAELLYGAGRRYDNLLLVKWGPGVGSAIITDGRLYEGRHGKAAELGHFIVERGGSLCRCGRRGCLETKVSWQALCREMPFLPERFGEAYRQAAAVGGADAFDAAIDLFARTIVNSMTILAPNRVVLFGPMFRDARIRRKLTDACCAYDARYDAQRILYSALAEKEEAIGPAAVFAQSVF